MRAGGPLDFLPIWLFFLATAAIVFGSVEGGYRLGKYRRQYSEPEKESPVGAIVAATLGLLAFTLAFTFGLAATRFDARRQVILAEANAIGTTHLRADFLPEPRRTEARRLLRDYVDARLEGIQPGRLDRAVARSTRLHALLWAQAVAAGQTEPRSVPVGLFIQSLNQLIDLHSERIQVAVKNRIPAVIWGMLYFVAVVAMAALGYHEGLASLRRSPAVLALVLTFSAVLALIADLDRPQEGLVRVSQQFLIDLRQSFEATGR